MTPRDVAAAPDARRLASGEPREPREPTIRVTIGRVEIRATPPASSVSPARPRTETPRLTLADYLAERAGP